MNWRTKNGTFVLSRKFDVNIEITKSEISNQLCGLKEILVHPSTKLFAGSKKRGREHVDAHK